jgi:hypothetical protein
MNYDRQSIVGAKMEAGPGYGVFIGESGDRVSAPSRTGHIIARLEKLVVQCAEQGRQVSSIADRVLGPVPEAVTKNIAGDAGPMPSAIGQIDRLVNALDDILNRNGHSINRLNEL